MIFEHREDAGRRLAAQLEEYRNRGALIVLGIPRGGLVVAAPVARALGAPLDVIIVRKIGAPFNEELAVGAVEPSGRILLDEDLIRGLKVDRNEVLHVAEQERKELARRLKKFRGDRPFPCLEGRTVILVDDGIATGKTVEAAVDGLQEVGVAELVLAVPVAPREAVAHLQDRVDRLVCLETPHPFYAVGQFYRGFQQVQDGEVTALLHNGWKEAGE